MNGIVIVDKPQNWTSMDVCAKLRGVFHEKRIGHGGTLDPMATGVLPVFVGRATRAVEFAADSEKEYIAGFKLGVVTNTQDTAGEVLEERPVSVTREDLEAALKKFRGEIDQVPPMYSAVKIGGKKLYELARKGREVERKPRHIVIKELKITRCIGPAEYELRVRCSKGTYIRTLCHDIGQALGCGGCMSALRRSMAGGFTLEDAVPLEDILSAPDPAALLRPVDGLFMEHPAVTLDAARERRCRCGNDFPCDAPDGLYRVYGADGEFLMLGRAEGGRMKTVKSFFEVQEISPDRVLL